MSTYTKCQLILFSEGNQILSAQSKTCLNFALTPLPILLRSLKTEPKQLFLRKTLFNSGKNYSALFLCKVPSVSVLRINRSHANSCSKIMIIMYVLPNIQSSKNIWLNMKKEHHTHWKHGGGSIMLWGCCSSAGTGAESLGKCYAVYAVILDSGSGKSLV